MWQRGWSLDQSRQAFHGTEAAIAAQTSFALPWVLAQTGKRFYVRTLCVLCWLLFDRLCFLCRPMFQSVTGELGSDGSFYPGLRPYFCATEVPLTFSKSFTMEASSCFP